MMCFWEKTGEKRRSGAGVTAGHQVEWELYVLCQFKSPVWFTFALPKQTTQECRKGGRRVEREMRAWQHGWMKMWERKDRIILAESSYGEPQREKERALPGWGSAACFLCVWTECVFACTKALVLKSRCTAIIISPIRAGLVLRREAACVEC